MRPDPRAGPALPRRITGYWRDDEGQWVAELECGHTQHLRHDPPWQSRPWVLTAEGREDRGAVRIGRHIAPSPGREPTDPGRVIDREEARMREGQFESQLRISERDGMLRIAVLSEPRDRGDAPDPGGPAGDARLLLVRCTTPATP